MALIPYDVAPVADKLFIGDRTVRLFHFVVLHDTNRKWVRTPDVGLNLSGTVYITALKATPFCRPLDRVWGDRQPLASTYPLFR